MMNRKLGIAVVCMLAIIFTQVIGLKAETSQDASGETEALIKFLKDRGTISTEEATVLKDRFVLKQKSGNMAQPRDNSKTREIPIQIQEEPARLPEPKARKMELPAKSQVQSEKGEEEVWDKIRRIEEKLDLMADRLLQKDKTVAKTQPEPEFEIKKKESEDSPRSADSPAWAQRIQLGPDMRLRKVEQSEDGQRIKLSADLRLRYQGNLYDEENADLLDPSDPETLLNTKEDRHRARYRVRVDAKAKLIDSSDSNIGKVETGIRLSSGNDADPVSTNDTFGDYQNKDGILIDRAYLKWTYDASEAIWGHKPRISLTGGRIPNPWFGAGLIWDNDLNFEGVSTEFSSDSTDQKFWNGFMNLGAFALQEEEFSHDDKFLYGAQIGIELRPIADIKGKISLAYFDYVNIEGVVNDPGLPGQTDFTAPIFQQKGNTLIDIDPSSDIKTALAADFNLINLTARAEYTGFSPVNISLVGDAVYNIGFDKKKVKEKTGLSEVSEDVFGFQLGMEAGYSTIREFGQWNTSLFYRYIESDAVLDAFTDSDFHDGGTNSRGWGVGLEFGLYKDVWFAMKWLSADEITGPPVAIDVFQIDLNSRF
ncbi:MAG: putative porin [Pseudomonadota bacterium]